MKQPARTHIITVALVALTFIAGLSSCGKRGEPVRPSEVEQAQ